MEASKPRKVYSERPCKKCGTMFSDYQCKKCVKVAKAAYYAANAERIKAEKAAYRAERRDVLNAKAKKYYRDNIERVREYAAQHYKEIAEKIKRARADHYAKNKEAVSAWSKAYYAANAARIMAYQEAYRQANPNKIKALSYSYRTANPEKIRIRNLNRLARQKSAGGKLSKDLASKLFVLQRGKCACCGRPLGDNYHMDHIVPLARGGLNEDSNIQLLRQRCNNQKQAKDPIEFMQSRGFLL